MRVPRPLRWLLVLAALALGWLAAGHLQESLARRGAEEQSRRGARPATTAPQTRPATTRAAGGLTR